MQKMMKVPAPSLPCALEVRLSVTRPLQPSPGTGFDGEHTGSWEARLHVLCLLRMLPRLSIDAQGKPDLLGSSPSLLLEVTEDAETVAATLMRGIAAVGSLMAHAAPEVDDGSVGADAVEAVGRLIQEIGGLTAYCVEIAAQCRQARTVRQSGE